MHHRRESQIGEHFCGKCEGGRESKVKPPQSTTPWLLNWIAETIKRRLIGWFQVEHVGGSRGCLWWFTATNWRVDLECVIEEKPNDYEGRFKFKTADCCEIWQLGQLRCLALTLTAWIRWNWVTGGQMIHPMLAGFIAHLHVNSGEPAMFITRSQAYIRRRVKEIN